MLNFKICKNNPAMQKTDASSALEASVNKKETEEIISPVSLARIASDLPAGIRIIHRSCQLWSY